MSNIQRKDMKIVGVTKCPTGIAHTYMAAARIEKECEKRGYEVKVETQGSQGTENILTRREIAKADYVIIAADVVIEEPERFYGKRVLKTRIKPLLKNTEGAFERLEKDSFIMGRTIFQSEKNQEENKNSQNQVIENFKNRSVEDRNVANGETGNADALNKNITDKNTINKKIVALSMPKSQKVENIVGKGYREDLKDKEGMASQNNFEDSNKSSKLKKEKKQEKEPKESVDIIGQLMNGASYMIPFVVVGGLFISLSLSMGAQTSADGTVIYIGLWDKVHAIGNLAFTLMYPILAGLLLFLLPEEQHLPRQ